MVPPETDKAAPLAPVAGGVKVYVLTMLPFAMTNATAPPAATKLFLAVAMQPRIRVLPELTLNDVPFAASDPR